MTILLTEYRATRRGRVPIDSLPEGQAYGAGRYLTGRAKPLAPIRTNARLWRTTFYPVRDNRVGK